MAVSKPVNPHLDPSRDAPAAANRRQGYSNSAPNSVPTLVLLLAGLAFSLVSGAAAAASHAELVLATWNLEHLAAAEGAGCRPRTTGDYRALHALGEQLEATIIAVQEVENRAALARVFDPAQYDLLISRRPTGHLGTCREPPGQAFTEQRTGFAIHRARLAALGLRYQRQADFSALASDGGRRWGTWIALLDADSGQELLQLLSIHLKSGCAWGALEGRKPVRRHACLILRHQRGWLEEWMDTRIAQGEAFAVLGDFNRQLDQPRDHFWADLDDGDICQWQADDDLGRRCRPGSVRAARNAQLRLANAGQPYPYPLNPKYPYAIDHLVFDATAGAWVQSDSYRVFEYPDPQAPLSDHHPIRLTVQRPEI
ncbi:endonuclease/exonuclease/phosphatase family protein [Rhabdochromatium marinum]|uniref:endonuclease/exonuclease/phosphatase family protein n=1 Tax=Rhabdochromatium marinum TaxID=48729 RepID=UPI00190721C8